MFASGLYFKEDHRKFAESRADSKFVLEDGYTGSIHQTGEQLIDGSPCNGWAHWYFEDKDNHLYVIDELREIYRKEYLSEKEE